MSEQSQALEQRSQTVARNVPVPNALAELGVRIAIDDATNQRLVLIPGAVRQRVNVIDPVTSLVQADPNWTPRISVVELNPDAKNGPHFYEQAGRKLAPTKQALEVLAKAAGILKTETERVAKAQLDEGEIGYRATVTIRRGDGTVETVQREKVWVEQAERAEIEDAVTAARAWENGQKTDKPKFDVPGTDAWDAEVKKRWLKELKDRSAKTESKAVLRAIRAALQIPHTFTPAEAAKPFLVIGFNFTPDEEIAKATLPAAIAALYGGDTGPVERINLDTGEVTTAQPSDVPVAAGPPADSDEDEPGLDRDGQQADAAATHAAASVPDDDADEPEPGKKPDEAAELAAAAQTVAETVAPVGSSFAGDTLAQVAAAGEEGVNWLDYALRHPSKYEDLFYASLETYVQGALPELWARHLEWREQKEAA